MKTILKILKDKTLRNRILFVAFILTLSRLIATVPISGVSKEELAKLFSGNEQLFGILNLFSGGGLSSLSIIMLGVGPYITASIIMQLVAVLYPKLKQMQQEDGTKGRQQFAQYTRYLTLPLAAVQGYALILLLVKKSVLPEMSHTVMALNILTVLGGTFLMLWLGELINERGIGNGVSLLIFGGILAGLPTKFHNSLIAFDKTQLPLYLALTIITLIVIAGIVYVTEAERPLEIAQAKQSRGYSDMSIHNSSYLPLRLNVAGVVPIIFAISFLTLPQMAAQVFSLSSNPALQTFANNIAVFLQNKWIYGIIYFALVFMFTYFYTFVTFDPVRTADQLQKAGQFVPGQRPGESTSSYLFQVLSRITTVGALFLGIIAILPIILQGITGFTAVQIGGTSILIAVSVALDLMKKVDAHLAMSEY